MAIKQLGRVHFGAAGIKSERPPYTNTKDTTTSRKET